MQRRFLHASQRGLTLFYSLLVISVVLVITTSIVNIVLKEVQLASFGKESQIAYYAAETGGECAIYWGAIQGYPFDGTQTITCGTDSGGSSQSIPSAGTSFTVEIGSDGACAEVNINLGSPTIVESRGYNVCPSLGTNGRRVERGIEVRY